MPATPEYYQKLLADIALTAKTRFRSATRLSYHQKVSQWAIALSSVVLVVAAILGMQDDTRRALPRAPEIEVILSVFVLALSLLIGMDNYNVRSDRMHTCSLELNDLVRRYRVLDETCYNELANAYGQILNKFENHQSVDYEKTILHNLTKEAREGRAGAGNTSWYRRGKWFMIFVKTVLSLFPYLLTSIAVLAAIFYFIIKLEFKWPNHEKAIPASSTQQSSPRSQ
jgi:hypothetical protein